MREPKLALELAPGITLGSRGLRELLLSRVNSITMVVRPDDPLLWVHDCKDKVLRQYRMVPCRDAHLGLSHSIRNGIEAVLPETPDAVLITLADQPFISSAMLNRLMAVFAGSPSLHYAASAQGDNPAPPVIIGKTLFPELLKLEGDTGAKDIFVRPNTAARLSTALTNAHPTMSIRQRNWKRHDLFGIHAPQKQSSSCYARNVRCGHAGSACGCIAWW